MLRRARQPIIPRDTGDRTGTRGILRTALADIRRRFAGLQREVLAIFDGIRIVAANADREIGRTIYALTPEEMAVVSTALRAALDRWLLAGKEASQLFWWRPYVEQAARAGTAQSVANLSQLSEAYTAARSLQQVLYSEPYRNRVAMAVIRSTDYWTGLAEEQRSTLAQIIGRAVVDGKNPKAVRAEIMERLDVGRSRAELYAQTDITNTLREARQFEAEAAQDQLGLRVALLWTSALLPTTRPTHAARNGRAYSVAEVRAFYERDGNRFRCHCGQTECLLDADGRPILSDKTKARFAAEREAWERAQAKRGGRP